MEESDEMGNSEELVFDEALKQDLLQKYKELTLKIAYETLKNTILHKRLVEYYKKRKMDYALQDLEQDFVDDDNSDAYKEKLLTYKDMKTTNSVKIKEIEDDLEKTKMLQDSQNVAISRHFDELQKLQRSTGTGLLYVQKREVIPDKLIERYLKIQRAKFYEAAEINLRYIRARNTVDSLQEELCSLETIAPGRYVSDYENLIARNQELGNKIEDSDNDLAKMRSQYANNNTIVSQYREKMNFNISFMETIKCNLGDVEMEYLKTRGDVKAVKKQLEHQRDLGCELKERTGLLAKQLLLLDFGETQRKFDDVEKNTEELKTRALEASRGKTS